MLCGQSVEIDATNLWLDISPAWHAEGPALLENVIAGDTDPAEGAQAFGQSMASQQQDTGIPAGYGCYETMIILRPDMSEEERCAPWRIIRAMSLHSVWQRHPPYYSVQTVLLHADTICCAPGT